jgi:hypothetical protein
MRLTVFPALNLVVPLGEVVLWALVIPLSVVRALGATLSYTSVFVLINNTASPETRGAGTRACMLKRVALSHGAPTPTNSTLSSLSRAQPTASARPSPPSPRQLARSPVAHSLRGR